jgi:hypothetical protein
LQIIQEALAEPYNKQHEPPEPGPEPEECAADEPPSTPPPPPPQVIEVHMVNPRIGVQTANKKIQARIPPRTATRRLQAGPSMLSTSVAPIISMVSIGVQCNILLSPPSEEPTPHPEEPVVQVIAPTPAVVAYIDEDEEEEDDVVADDANDPDYKPIGEEEEDDDYAEDVDDVGGAVPLRGDLDTGDVIQFMVSERALNILLSVCQSDKCNSQCQTVVHTRGSMIATRSVCENGHVHEWRSQSCHGRLPWSNLLTAGAVLFSGCNPAKVLQLFRGMNLFSARTYNRIQKVYLIPSVIETWTRTKWT